MKTLTRFLSLALLVIFMTAPWATADSLPSGHDVSRAVESDPVQETAACVAVSPTSVELPLFQPSFMLLPPPDLCTPGAPCTHRVQCGWDASGFQGICHNGQCYCY